MSVFIAIGVAKIHKVEAIFALYLYFVVFKTLHIMK